MTGRDILDVFLHGAHVGNITRNGSTVAFQFTDDYIDDPERKVLSLAFEEDIRRTRYTSRRLPNWFGHLLPEGQLRDLLELSLGIAPELGADRYDIESRLLSEVGSDLPGAVQVQVSTNEEHPRLRTRDDNPLPPAEQSTQDDGRLRFSIAGVRLKFSMLQSNHRFTAPARGVHGDWLLKLPDRTFPHLPLNEYATMKLARAAKIDVPEIHLVHRDAVSQDSQTLWSGEEFAFAIKRFDRVAGRMVHIEDFAQVRDLAPGLSKYGGNFESVGSLVWHVLGSESFEEFLRRLAFSLMIGNSDAHLKNWSVIYPDDVNPSLSPAYDLVSVVAYSNLDIDTSLALRLANRRRYDQVALQSIERLVRKVGAPESALDAVVETVRLTLDNFELWENQMAEHRELLSRTRSHMESMAPRLA